MSAVLVFVKILLALLAIVLIVSVLAQEGTRQGIGAITGGAETFFGKNKAKTMESKLEIITKIAATTFIILAIISAMLTSSINKSTSTATTETADTAVTETAESEDVVEEEAETEGEEAEAETEGESEEG